MTQLPSSRLMSRLQRVLLATSCLLAIASASGAQLNLSSRPLYAGGAVPPMVMIDLSKDHSLHQKAYNDYTDLDGGGIDSTYKNSIEYAGYFDSYKCYDYDASGVKGFYPKSVTTTKYCDGKTWSGNFLNWASMSRIDEVRKILYGGTRSTDTATQTILERAFLPMDAHAWAKYYAGTDIAQLTPFSVELPADVKGVTSTTSMSLSPAVRTISVSSTSDMQIGDQIQLKPTNGNAGASMIGWISSVGTGQITLAIYNESITNPTGTASNYNNWSVLNLTRGGLTLCNVTPKDSNNLNSQSNTQPPQIRVVRGNYATWGASEKWQCNWYSEASNTQNGFLPAIGNTAVTGSSNGNRAAISGITSSAENPPKAGRGLGTGQDTGTYNARVQVCVPSLIGTENCKQYGTSYKPYGLLQKYGETGQMLFGLMTGTYDKNISGGVLRRNVTNFASEINQADGTFVFTGTNGVKGIVWNIDKLRPYGYSYSDGGYTSADACNYQQTSIVPSGGSTAQNKPANEGNCSTWGNPMSEIYIETLRYFGGLKQTTDFQPKTSGKDTTLGLTQAVWANPMDLPSTDANKAPYCSPMNALVFNASVTSYDNDQVNILNGLAGTPNVSTYTDTVGAGEGVNGKSWFAGGVNGGVIDNLCSAKSVGKFSDVLGICPEGPSQLGTFQIAGAALFAHMNRIRDGSKLGVPTSDTTSLKVSTYAVQLATTTPKINVNVNGKTVTIMPAYQLHPTGVVASSGTLVDFKVISQDATSGKFYVNWEDSTAGGDYDQDVWGILSYSVSGNNITVTTRVVSASTNNGQGFGYAISGTDKDGPHFHSGILGFNYTDPVPVTVSPNTKVDKTGGCSGCQLGDSATSVTYSASGNAAAQFQDPLLYAAKWGGFKDLNGSGTPDQASEWDVRLQDGTPGSDGIPDNYFYATNPGALSAALERAFLSILKTSSASAAATNSASLSTDTAIYQARFNGSDWSGQLLAYGINTDGSIKTPEIWDAGAKFAGVAASARQILTYNYADNTSAGIPFRWDRLPDAYKTALNTTDTLGSKRLDWLRGDQSNEGDAATQFRTRPVSVLGDIIDSAPQYVGPPNSGFSDPAYAQFVAARRTRKPMLYVGANDGMMHAFSAAPTATSDGGRELFAYVPSTMYPKLANLTAKGYTHAYYVNSTPTVADAVVNGNWRTVLVGGLGGGGRGVYALDVTDPTAISEGTAASTVLWEFTSANDPDLGYVYGQPQLIRFSNGKWAAVFGNGYNSNAGRGAIFIVMLDRPAGKKTWVLGTDYYKLTLDDAGTTASNGVVQVFPTDGNGDGFADSLYAGDLLGNVWRFDFGAGNPSLWQLSRRKLMVATDNRGKAQPISTSPVVRRHPQGGYLVLVGTGRFVDTADPTDMSVQSVYGVWDQDKSTQATVTREKMQAQYITQETQVNGNWYRLITANAFQYAPGGTQGWYMDLIPPGTAATAQGERVIYSPILRSGRLIFVTAIPSTDVCDNGGSSWLMEFDSLTGGQLTTAPFDVSNDGKFDASDLLVGDKGDGTTGKGAPGGVKTSGGIATSPTVLDGVGAGSGGGGGGGGGGNEMKYIVQSNGTVQAVPESNSTQKGRLTWRQIMR
ncbi:pilus assembly protein [Cupriavidus plantarum]|uniref:pilus assembly protein n=1 Tax=Cupriavidus plantarum TaxID=942865 RepID=UPI000EB14305|nr:PilC/PilY family type IV pilus protein [Cupriavidus plantarum]RLK35454.1 type IV pilus assembly protein PilY1 [Cupriavidus plantarum]